MFKKYISLLLTAVLVLSLAGCGNNLNAAIEVLEAVDELAEAVDTLTGESSDIGIIGGADGPTAVIVGTADEDYAETEYPEDDFPGDQGTRNTAAGGSDTIAEDYGAAIDEYGTYNSVEDVSLYLYTFDCLPENYITKNEARDLGWTGGSVEDWAGEGYAIGGDKFGNREGLLPKTSGRQYYECDIDTWGRSDRGAKRIVYSNDGLIYYTENHYESFTLLYGEE